MIIYQQRTRRQQKPKSSTRRTETMKERRSICFREPYQRGPAEGGGATINYNIINIF